MAINFAALLGGFGSGYQQAQQQRRQNRREDLAELRADQAQSNTIFNQIQELVRTDAADEQKTLQDLRTAGLDPAMRQALMDQRRQRHLSAQQTISSLSGQPGILKQYGNVKNMLAPSMLMSGGFDVKPYMSEEGLRSIAAMGTKEAREADMAEKSGVIERYRQDLLQYAPKEYVDRILPQVGASLGYAAPKQATPLQRPQDIGKLAAQIPGFIPGVGGERILPTGNKQRIYFKDGKPVVDYQKAMVADYTPPEATRLRNQKMAEELRQLRGMFDYKRQLAAANIENKEWQTNFLRERVKAYGPESQARIKRYLNSNSSRIADTNAKLRLLSILLSAEQRQQGLNLDERQFGFDVANKRQELISDIDKNIAGLRANLRDFGVQRGQAMDTGFRAKWAELTRAGKDVESAIAQLESQKQALVGGNVGMAGQILGGYGDIGAINPMSLLSSASARGDMIQQMALMNMMRGPQQSMPQQIPMPIPIPMGAPAQQIDPNLLMAIIGGAQARQGGQVPGGQPGGPGVFPGRLNFGTLEGAERQRRLQQLIQAYPKAYRNSGLRSAFDQLSTRPELTEIERGWLQDRNR